MPIEVRCPNPGCDQMHRVKSKYAGMRGRCPNCGGWMIIPERESAAPRAAQRLQPGDPDALAETAAWTTTPVEERSDLPEEQPEPVRAGKAAHRYDPDDEIAPEREDGVEVSPPPSYFNAFALVFLFLAVVALGAVAGLVPFMQQPSLHLTGDLPSAGHIAHTRLGYTEEGQPWLIGLSAAAAGLAFLTFFVALVRRRFGVLALLPAYLALLAAWGSLVLTGDAFRDRLDQATRLDKESRAWVAANAGKTGELTIHWGQSLFLGAGCSAAGFLLLSLALLLLHQGVLSRLLFFLTAGLLIAAAGFILFRGEMGFDLSLPVTL